MTNPRLLAGYRKLKSNIDNRYSHNRKATTKMNAPQQRYGLVTMERIRGHNGWLKFTAATPFFSATWAAEFMVTCIRISRIFTTLTDSLSQ
jgi:hypothetical protein